MPRCEKLREFSPIRTSCILLSVGITTRDCATMIGRVPNFVSLNAVCRTTPTFSVLSGSIDRRQGQWKRIHPELQRAVDVDPGNLFRLQQLAASYHVLAALRRRATNLRSRAGDRSRGQEYASLSRPDRSRCARRYWTVCAKQLQNSCSRTPKRPMNSRPGFLIKHCAIATALPPNARSRQSRPAS